MSASAVPSSETQRWSWASAILAVVVLFDLVAITLYLWEIPEARFDNLKKVITTLATWLSTIGTAFGIRYQFRRQQPLRVVLTMRPVRLGIIVATVAIWFFVVPFHGITISTYAQQAGGPAEPLEGVAVLVEGKRRGVTALEEASSTATFRVRGLRARVYDVVLTRANYEPESLTVSFADVIKFGKAPVKTLLQPATGYVTVICEPTGAAVFLDRDSSTSHGAAPVTVALGAGEHFVRCVPRGRYYASDWERVVIPAVDTVRHRILLSSIARVYHDVRIVTDPAGAAVYVDDETSARGITPVWIRLSQGTHTLRLIKSDYHEEVQQVLINESTRKAFRLRRAS